MQNLSFLGYFSVKKRFLLPIFIQIYTVPSVPSVPSPLARHSSTATPIGGFAIDSLPDFPLQGVTGFVIIS